MHKPQWPIIVSLALTRKVRQPWPYRPPIVPKKERSAHEPKPPVHHGRVVSARERHKLALEATMLLHPGEYRLVERDGSLALERIPAPRKPRKSTKHTLPVKPETVALQNPWTGTRY